MADDTEQQINAMPTKAFFVEMFTKDISLDQALLDLVDNSVDGAKRQNAGNSKYDGNKVDIVFNSHKFSIVDNCGGFSKEQAINYAFRFGRPPKSKPTPHSIGQFGVGMKRALFKFGTVFTVASATSEEKWAVHVNAKTWEDDDKDWHFPWGEFPTNTAISTSKPGTDISVMTLHPSVASVFGTQYFENQIVSLIRSKHRSFISSGLAITVNKTPVLPIELTIKAGSGLQPEVFNQVFEDKALSPVRVRVIVGVAESSPRLAGWYVICNGRIILEADRRVVTGWGVVEDASSKTAIPGFHNQYARFRGIVTFDSDDSARVPWNTTKTDVDQDNEIWREIREKMIELMRPVIDFLNELDADIETNTRERSPLYKLVEERSSIKFEALSNDQKFSAPLRSDLGDVVPYTKIQYSKTVDDVEFLKKALNQKSAKAVGEKTFDLILQRQRGQ